MNNAAAIGFLIYLSLVISEGKGDELISEVTSEKKFFIWAVSLTALYNIRNVFGDVSRGLFALLIIGILLNLLPRVFEVQHLLTEAVNIDNSQNFKGYTGEW